ncbi:MAG TPA: hypothetical protein VMU34_27085 [Mycobacterium sp.]|nr:hypothetical protein [Mycobacterium sp.]
MSLPVCSGNPKITPASSPPALAVIVSTLHVHLDHHNCLEVLVVRGKAPLVKRIADELIAAKGVKHGKATVTSTGKDLPG